MQYVHDLFTPSYDITKVEGDKVWFQDGDEPEQVCFILSQEKSSLIHKTHTGKAGKAKYDATGFKVIVAGEDFISDVFIYGHYDISEGEQLYFHEVDEEED
mgnify:CR=1 FL=1